MVNVVYSYITLTYFEVSKILCKHSVDGFFHVFFCVSVLYQFTGEYPGFVFGGREA